MLLIAGSNVIAQNSAILKVEKSLTNGNEKKWVYSETVKTMGNRQMKSVDCSEDTLTFIMANKSYQGSICDGEETNIKTWKIEGDDEDELYINLGQKYMIDIYSKVVNGNKVEYLRLKKISHVKDESSVGYIYVATN